VTLALRPLQPADTEKTVRTWRASRLDAYRWMRPEQLHTLDEDRSFFADFLIRECEIFVAEHEGEIEGLLALRGERVEQLFVGPDAQGRGVGSALLALAKGRSPGGLELFTLQRNARARRFYERRGFRALRFGVSPAPENEPDVFYRWLPRLRGAS
jgi:putative acetyltransferase